MIRDREILTCQASFQLYRPAHRPVKGPICGFKPVARLLAMPEEKKQRRRPPGRKGAMIRKIAYLYEDEAEGLEAESERKKCSEAEVIRRALRSYLKL